MNSLNKICIYYINFKIFSCIEIIFANKSYSSLIKIKNHLDSSSIMFV